MVYRFEKENYVNQRMIYGFVLFIHEYESMLLPLL